MKIGVVLAVVGPLGILWLADHVGGPWSHLDFAVCLVLVFWILKLKRSEGRES